MTTMTKSYFFLVLVSSLVLVKICSAKSIRNGKSSNVFEPIYSFQSKDPFGDDDSGDEEEPESDSEEVNEIEKNPTTSCLLFGNKGCHVECDVIAQVYDIKGEGYCNRQLTCQCELSGDVSLHDRWNKIFDADYVYRKINEDDYLENRAHDIFSSPLRSGEEIKQLFKGFLSPYQFSKLKNHDDSMAAQFTENGEGKIDEEAVQKFVSQKVGKLLKSKDNKSLLSTKYIKKFKRFLHESRGVKGTLYNVAYKVHSLKNGALEEALKEYLMTNKLEEPQVGEIEDNDLVSIVTNSINNEIMKAIDLKNNARDEKKSIPAKAASKKDVDNKKY